jgi:hypothetical protein
VTRSLTATWHDDNGKPQQSGPMAMTELIPHLEATLGITREPAQGM